MYLLTNVDEHRYAAPAGGDVPYVIDIFPLTAGLAAIATDQTLSLFEPSALHSKGAIRTLRTPHANITVAAPFDQAQSTVCTAGSDGTVAIWDLRVGAGQVTRQIGTPGRDFLSLFFFLFFACFSFLFFFCRLYTSLSDSQEKDIVTITLDTDFFTVLARNRSDKYRFTGVLPRCQYGCCWNRI